MRLLNVLLGIVGMALLVSACGGNTDPNQAIVIHERAADGGLRIIKDSLPAFEFYNQEGDTITNAALEGKIYVTDFFFTHCPTICPKMAQQMLRIYEKYEENEQIVLLSHSIDTRNDTIAQLKKYAQKLEVSAPKWHFVTGNYDEISAMAEAYMAVAYEDEDAPGGYNHSGHFVLVDGKGRIRSFCTGTDPDAVSTLMKDIDLLLKEGNDK